MTHTTEQPEALRLADALAERVSLTATGFGFDADLAYAAAELRRLHARVQELEASQAQRVPLSEEQRRAIFDDLWPHGADAGIRKLFTATVFATEAAHGITKEKP